MNENRVQKLAEENKTEEMLADQEIGQAEAIDESIQTAIAAAIAAQIVTAATAPVQQTEAITETSAAVETTVPQAVIPVMQNQPSTVIQLPETEPQPLPDELKQAVQQPKVEVKRFSDSGRYCTQNLENQLQHPMPKRHLRGGLAGC